MEALREVEAELTVYVHPSNAADVPRAVSRQLSGLLFSYEERFDGVLLAHEAQLVDEDNKENATKEKDKKEAKIEEETEAKSKKKPKILKAKILNGLVPFFGVRVHANLLLFSPQPGMLLEGKVEMLGKESIHAVVLGVFSVAIMSDDIHEKFRFKRKSHGGRFLSRSDREHFIKRGTMIRFSVKSVDTEMNCHITGSLIPPHTGSMRWLSVHDAEYASEISSRWIQASKESRMNKNTEYSRMKIAW
ncbi:unnamed protein product [Urochloa decumbens]|uniref:DNA-directed RNA polymerase subunit n=1 Tax=Urochloa decumbens TaxID=240449 RepID=A0ABC8VJB7_9POAL